MACGRLLRIGRLAAASWLVVSRMRVHCVVGAPFMHMDSRLNGAVARRRRAVEHGRGCQALERKRYQEQASQEHAQCDHCRQSKPSHGGKVKCGASKAPARPGAFQGGLGGSPKYCTPDFSSSKMR